jgi:hypothetical protein
MSSFAVLFDASRIAIQPHTCPECLGPMILAHIKSSRIGFELRMFQGVNCDHVDKVVSETHSMKWMSSGLERRFRSQHAPWMRSRRRHAGFVGKLLERAALRGQIGRFLHKHKNEAGRGKLPLTEDTPSDARLGATALSRWHNEGGAVRDGLPM